MRRTLALSFWNPPTPRRRVEIFWWQTTQMHIKVHKGDMHASFCFGNLCPDRSCFGWYPWCSQRLTPVVYRLLLLVMMPVTVALALYRLPALSVAWNIEIAEILGGPLFEVYHFRSTPLKLMGLVDRIGWVWAWGRKTVHIHRAWARAHTRVV